MNKKQRVMWKVFFKKSIKPNPNQKIQEKTAKICKISASQMKS